MGHGKTVLFVAEKMAALEVVKRRLGAVGLGDACLELHSRKTSKQLVLQELDRTMRLGRPRLEQAEDNFVLNGAAAYGPHGDHGSPSEPRTDWAGPLAREATAENFVQFLVELAFYLRILGKYERRAGIEGTFSRTVSLLGIRRTRYRGLEKVDLEHVLTAVTLSILRVMEWLGRITPPKSLISASAKLAA